jgi:hypothetical protein
MRGKKARFDKDQPDVRFRFEGGKLSNAIVSRQHARPIRVRRTTRMNVAPFIVSVADHDDAGANTES